MLKLSKNLAILFTLLLLLGITTMASAVPGDRYAYDEHGDKDFMTNTNILERYLPTGNSNNQSYKVTSPRAQADASFTTDTIVVDGVRDTAWETAVSYPISNKFNTSMTADAPSATTEGAMRFLWDGPVLYILVEVSGDSTQSDSGTPNWGSATYTPNTDGLFVFMDVFNDKWGMETDTQGVFFMGANPALTSVTSFNNGGIPSLGSFFHPNNQDYSTRLNAIQSSGYTPGDGVNYTYEIALQIEGWGDAWEHELANGTQVGLEVAIFDQGQSFTYWSKTEYFAGREGNSNLPNSERVRNRDWGEVTLAGWDGVTQFAYSGWCADEDIRFWNSKSNPGGSGNGTGPDDNGDGSLVWTAVSKNRLLAAMDAYEAIKDSATATRAEKETAVQEVCEAFAGLRWGDTRFPDPHDLPSVHTLPNVWQFFDPAKGTNGMVTNEAEWAERKQEILELAQFYEYGYKPQNGVDYTLNLTSNDYTGTGTAVVTAEIIPTNVNYAGGVAQNVTVSVSMPTTGVPEGYRAPISFGGSWTANGIANISFPNWAGDSRSDTGAWGNPNRSGTFYTIFPYSRNSTSADSSILIANATAVSVYLDILELAVAENPYLDTRIDPQQAITKGFSIGGKNAFVAAVFDERVKAVVAGGAGATGPANWRYNVQGQEYDFTGTIFYNPGAENIVSHGTEGPGNSYRHNRVRETELFRHFLPYGHMYAHEEGAYGYGAFSRLPFDQALLVATFAPDRAIIIDTNINDYNDGAVTDNMSLQIAKSVYEALGVNGDDFVKFNSGNYISSGDPHGAASGAPEGRYFSDFFYGTETLIGDEASRLNTDPYELLVANEQTQSPYDYYWGGYNTITGGDDGIDGTDGWYHYDGVTVSPQIVLNVQPAPNLELLVGYDATHSLYVKAQNVGASGTLAYQWYENSTASTTGGTPINGAISDSYEIPTGMGVGTSYYYVVVTSTTGADAVTSAISQVTVRTPSTDATLKSVAISLTSGFTTSTYNGTPHPTEPFAFNIELPYGTNLDNVAVSAFAIAANDPGATVDAPVKFDNGERWEISVTAEDGLATATYSVYISAPFVPVESISGLPTNIAVGTDLRLTDVFFGSIITYNIAEIAPENASNQSISWSVDDPAVASIVSASGGFFTTVTSLHLESGATVGTEVELTATITNGASPSTNYTQTFTLTVVNPLADLVVSSGTLTPSFDAETTDYTVFVPNDVSTFNVTPILADDISGTITVNGEPVADGQNSLDVDLDVGSTLIEVVVTADGGEPTTYFVTVNRLPYELSFCAITADGQLKLYKNSQTDCGVLVNGKADIGQGVAVGGDVVAADNILLKRNALVWGDAITAESVVIQRSATVHGDVVENTAVSQPALPTFNITAGNQPIEVAANTTLDLAPGIYGDLKVNEDATLNLSGGAYTFEDIEINTNASLNFDITDEAVVISIEDGLFIENNVVMTSNSTADNILIQINGSQIRIGENSTLLGTFVAPHAFIDVQKDTSITGALYGQTVHVKEGSTIIGLPAVQLYFEHYVAPATSE